MRKIIFTENEFYHVYNRGTEKRTIFMDLSDYDRFQRILYLANGSRPFVTREIPRGVTYGNERGEPLVDVGAYCLMPNHFHILLRAKDEEGVTTFMRKLLTSYSMYFNQKHERTGRLFQGTFKASNADSDPYLRHLFSYIHLNPIKLIDPYWKERGIRRLDKSKEHLLSYRHSSYLDYKGMVRPENVILNRTAFPPFINTIEDLDASINAWLNPEV